MVLLIRVKWINKIVSFAGKPASLNNFFAPCIRKKIDSTIKNNKKYQKAEMIVFPDLTGKTHFPYPEGYQFEFKETASRLCTEKLLATICGFLNNEGGYFIVGICDDRKIVGVKQNKELDNFLGRVDSIYHDRFIVYDDGTPISFETIKSWNISLKNRNVLCIIQAIPEPDKKYRLHTGETYYRLSSSNYRLTNINNQITVSQFEMDAMIFNKTISIKRQYDNYIDKTKKRI